MYREAGFEEEHSDGKIGSDELSEALHALTRSLGFI